MLWKEVKSWCKTHGYYANREKQTHTENSYIYSWYKESDRKICGTTTSVSKLATIIFNTTTDNKYIEYQQEYIKEQNKEDIEHFKEGWR